MDELTYDRLVAFMYVLLRDEVPIGRMAKIIKEVRIVAPGTEMRFASSDIAVAARAFVREVHRT